MKLWGYALIGKKKLVGNINDVAPYIMSYNSTNVLCRGSPSLSIVENVGFIGEEVKGHACRYVKMMGESINLAFHTWVVIKHIAIEVAKFRGVPL